MENIECVISGKMFEIIVVFPFLLQMTLKYFLFTFRIGAIKMLI